MPASRPETGIETRHLAGDTVADMSDGDARIACPVVVVGAVDGHPDADLLELSTVRGWTLVVAKGEWRAGDTAVYIPEQSILPDSLIEELGLTGKLAGPDANRVKAIRLRGVVSQGLLLPMDSPHLSALESPQVGDDVSGSLGVVKWEPPIPENMEGLAAHAQWSAGFGDIDHWQDHPDRFDSGEVVHITEKLHGVCCVLGHDPEHGPFAASKGLAGKLSFIVEHPDNEDNVYVMAWRQHGEIVESLAKEMGQQVAVMGEIVGPGIQDLNYRLPRQRFFMFDMKVGGEWVDPVKVRRVATELEIPHVPVVGHMPFDHAAVLRLASEQSILDGGLREGVVVRPEVPRYDLRGRVISRYINPAYLLRKGGTERR